VTAAGDSDEMIATRSLGSKNSTLKASGNKIVELGYSMGKA
jgi:hypothetical protein